MDKRTVALDAAILVIAGQGMRGLTHRAVDALAGLPLGSTSNYFRTRRALIAGVFERLVARDREDMAAAAGRAPRTVAELADALARYVGVSVGPGAELTRARYALFAEAAGSAELRPLLLRRREELTDLAVALVEGVRSGEGGPTPRWRVEAAMGLLDGLILQRLTGTGGVDDGAILRGLLAGVLDVRPQSE